jgi:RNA polymerase sigma-70 factor, ECF subfamily
LVEAPMGSPDPDVELMVAVQRGNTSAFEQIVFKYNKLIVNFIYKFVNNIGEAEELAQDVFLKIYLARDSYEPRARFSSWIYRIAANEGIKAARKKRRVFFRHTRRDDYATRDDLEALPDGMADAERSLVDREKGEIVRMAIHSLPQKEKLAIILLRYQDLSYGEIAEVMNCTEGAVKTYIHRGKLHLRDFMLPYMAKGLI